MDLEAGFEIHTQGSLVVLFGPWSLPIPLDRIGCRIAFCNMQLFPTKLVACSSQKCSAYALSSVSRSYEKAHDRANWLGRVVYDDSIPPHVKEARARLRVAPTNHPSIYDG